jgi:hypothetical protein
MIYVLVKSNIIVDVKDLQTKMEQLTILKWDNNFHTLSTTIEELQQEIIAKKGNDFCKDDKLLTELVHAAKATNNEAFAMNIHLTKSAWITGKITDKNVIINDLNGLYCNMVTDGSWKKVNSADSKIITSTTQIRDLKKQLVDSDHPKGSGKQGKDPKNPTKLGKEVGKDWRYNKVGDTLKCPDTGATLKWCPHHGTGAYMPMDHKHKEWLDKKKHS